MIIRFAIFLWLFYLGAIFAFITLHTGTFSDAFITSSLACIFFASIYLLRKTPPLEMFLWALALHFGLCGIIFIVGLILSPHADWNINLIFYLFGHALLLFSLYLVRILKENRVEPFVSKSKKYLPYLGVFGLVMLSLYFLVGDGSGPAITAAAVFFGLAVKALESSFQKRRD